MHVTQQIWHEHRAWETVTGVMPPAVAERAQLVLAFGSCSAIANVKAMRQLQEMYPRAEIVGCSTAGEISDTRVFDESIVATAVAFTNTAVRVAEASVPTASDSAAAGEVLATKLLAPDLSHVLVISEGLNVNASELINHLTAKLPEGVAVTGGLSGDGGQFKQTLVFARGTARQRRVIAIGFYGSSLGVGYGSLGGWEPFGPQRIITRSDGNVLYELDGQTALAFYKKYLGEQAAQLPASGLRFPLNLRRTSDDTPVVRTVLGVDERNESLIFAGDVPQGSTAQLMRATFDRLTQGASGAAMSSRDGLNGRTAELAILISCVGRRLILQHRTEEEVKSVRAVLGPQATLAGFYSYGEMAPFKRDTPCVLHNQTMTITVFSEAA